MSSFACLAASSLVPYLLLRLLHPAPWILAPLLLGYEASTKSSRFSQNSYSCTVCLESYKGSKCLQLSCSHIFCRACLESFWTLCITEGDVGRVGCPDPECVKSGKDANEEEVARVVTEDDLRRWRWLREKRAIEKGTWNLMSVEPGLTLHRSIYYSLSTSVLPVTGTETPYRRRRRFGMG